MSSRRSGGASTSWELQLGTAGLLGGTTAYPQLAPAAAPLRAAPEPRPSDGKVTWLLLTWSLVATVLWVYQFTLAATSSDPSTNPLLFARTTQTACPERKWHGGSPLDTYKGSCYCGSDTYCMCTPSLAIDAIIEVWNYNKDKDKEKETTVASAGAAGGGKGAEAGENTSSSRGKRGVGGPSASGEGGGGSSGVKAATGGAGAGQEQEGRPERTRKGPPGARRHGSGGGGHGNAFAAGGRVLTAVDTSTSTSTSTSTGTGVLRSLWALASSASSSSTTAASSSNAETGGSKGAAAVAAASTAAAAVATALPLVPTTTTRTGPGQSGGVNSADVAIVLVYRGAPPAGYAIPGGFVEVGPSSVLSFPFYALLCVLLTEGSCGVLGVCGGFRWGRVPRPPRSARSKKKPTWTSWRSNRYCHSSCLFVFSCSLVAPLDALLTSFLTPLS